ncbi:MAG: hypothetical protein ACKOA8_02230, partial [Deltaproteobacteria bacterium]
MTLVEYFEKLMHADFDNADLALTEFLKRRLGRRLQREANLEEAKEVYEKVKSAFESSNVSEETKGRIFREWFSLSVSSQVTEQKWIEQLIKKGKVDNDFAQYVLSQPHSKDHPEWVQLLINKGSGFLADTYRRYLVETTQGIEVDLAYEICKYVLSQPHWKDHPEFVEQLIKRVNIWHRKGHRDVDQIIVDHVLSKPHWKEHPTLVQQLIKKGTVDKEIAKLVLSQPQWIDHPELVQQLIEKGIADYQIAEYVLSKSHWKDHPELVRQLIEKGTDDFAIT